MQQERTVLLALIGLFLTATTTPLYAANYQLEILNIKPAGTGSPVIPANNRIFNAYPGIEYNIRAAVTGGMYPYAFALDNAPAGMTINAASGEIVWADPQANAGPIVLTVKDAENTTVSTMWSISVSTSGFLFVDDSYSGTATGSITQPFSSIGNLLSKAGSANANDIVYFREGTYRLPSSVTITSKPQSWIGYPGEKASIDAMGYTLSIYTSFYFDNLTIHNMLDHGIHGGSAYTTIRRCRFYDLTSSTSVNNNQGMLFLEGCKNLVIQDNEFTAFTGGQAMGSLYSVTKALIENNYTHDGGYAGPHSFCTPIGLKAMDDSVTIRGNIIDIPSDAATQFELYGGTTRLTHDLDICFNYIVRRGNGSQTVISFMFPKNVHCYRNTFVGAIVFSTFSPADSILNQCGPFDFKNNVFINPNTGSNTYEYFSFKGPSTPQAYYNAMITDTDNLKGKPGDNVVDVNGNLTSAYSQFIGTRGWQLAGGTLPTHAAQGMVVNK